MRRPRHPDDVRPEQEMVADAFISEKKMSLKVRVCISKVPVLQPALLGLGVLFSGRSLGVPRFFVRPSRLFILALHSRVYLVGRSLHLLPRGVGTQHKPV